MEIEKRLVLLQSIYQIYDDFVADLDVACRKTCAVCCTCNVTLTTLEGLLIVRQLTGQQQEIVFDQVRRALPQARFQPTISINRMAQMCAQGIDIPDETADPGMGRCLLLSSEICPIYATRPIACRTMLSTTVCTQGGQAHVPPFVLTVNQTILQYLEAIDTPGFSGNLIDILALFSNAQQKDAYEAQRLPPIPAGLTPNLDLSVLMIPPEHRKRIAPLLQSIQQAIGQIQ